MFQIIKVDDKQDKRWELTEEGQSVLQKGSHEALVYNAVPKDGILQSQLMVI